MLITRSNPQSIDYSIAQLQKHLHDELMGLWGLDTEDPEQGALYRCYDRCNRNKREGGYVAEIYLGANEYEEVYWHDDINAISFFGTGAKEEHAANESTQVHLVFFVNLAKLKPGITHRADAEVRKDVQNVVSGGWYGFTHTSTEIWLENVLREYPGSYRDQRLKAVDMHPVHCFRLNFEVAYNKNIC